MTMRDFFLSIKEKIIYFLKHNLDSDLVLFFKMSEKQLS